VRDEFEYSYSLANSVLKQVFIPGRFEKRVYKDHLVILDGAHNPQKLLALSGRLQRENKSPVTIVYAAGSRKDLAACLRTLKPIAARVIATEYFTKQQDIPISPAKAEVILALGQNIGIECFVEKSPQAAFKKAAAYSEPIVVTGSFYLLGEIDEMF